MSIHDDITREVFMGKPAEGVGVLFAVESGSRMWGFASADSDYDVRYVYRRPAREYISVTEPTLQREFQLPGDLDICGWDLQKFLHLLGRSNPSCFEWLASPIVYGEDINWTKAREVAPEFFSPRGMMCHYISMAKHNYREHMRDGQAENVRLKKYLYITRPLLCAEWILRNPGTPPMNFDQLVDESSDYIPTDLARALYDLAERKRAGEELSAGKAVPVVNTFIQCELAALPDRAAGMPVARGNLAVLDELLRKLVYL